MAQLTTINLLTNKMVGRAICIKLANLPKYKCSRLFYERCINITFLRNNVRKNTLQAYAKKEPNSKVWWHQLHSLLVFCCIIISLLFYIWQFIVILGLDRESIKFGLKCRNIIYMRSIWRGILCSIALQFQNPKKLYQSNTWSIQLH